jgi:hypothetical protein
MRSRADVQHRPGVIGRAGWGARTRSHAALPAEVGAVKACDLGSCAPVVTAGARRGPGVFGGVQTRRGPGRPRSRLAPVPSVRGRLRRSVLRDRGRDRSAVPGWPIPGLEGLEGRPLGLPWRPRGPG